MRMGIASPSPTSMTDPLLPPIDLVEHAAFVRRLAFQLLRDDAAADDAAQETIVRALERPPREGPGIRAWLVTVLRNVVRMGVRGRIRSHLREGSVSVADSGPSVADVVAREELLRLVVDAVRSLDPAHREVVLLRHYEDLPPRVIATRLGVPVETVKSRLKRAHERLRERLEARGAGGVGGWRSGLAIVVGLDVTGRSSAPVGGIIAMGAATKVGVGVAAAVVLACGGWWIAARPPERESPSLVNEVSRSRSVDSQTGPASDSGLSVPDRSTPRAAMGSQGPAVVSAVHDDRLTDEAFHALEREVEHGRIEGIVMAGTRPLGVGRARLWADYVTRVFGGSGHEEPISSVLIAADGTFSMDGIRKGAFALEIEPAGSASRLMYFVMPKAPEKTRRRVVALEGARVAGTVFDRLGEPAVGAVVNVGPHIVSHPMRGFQFQSEVRTGADGSFEVDRLPAGPYWIVAHLGPDWWTTRDDRTLKFEAKAGEFVRLDLGSARVEPRWSGVVRARNGKVVRGPKSLELRPKGGDGLEAVPYDATGSFSRRLPPGAYSVSVVFTDYGAEPQRRPVEIHPDVTIADHDLVSDLVIPGARVSGGVKDVASGSALVKRTDQRVLLTPEGKDHLWSQGVWMLADGTFELDGVAPGRYVISGYPLALRDSSGRPVTVAVREGEPEVTVELWAAKE